MPRKACKTGTSKTHKAGQKSTSIIKRWVLIILWTLCEFVIVCDLWLWMFTDIVQPSGTGNKLGLVLWKDYKCRKTNQGIEPFCLYRMYNTCSSCCRSKRNACRRIQRYGCMGKRKCSFFRIIWQANRLPVIIPINTHILSISLSSLNKTTYS